MHISENGIGRLLVESDYGRHAIKRFLWPFGIVAIIASFLLALTLNPPSFMGWVIGPLMMGAMFTLLGGMIKFIQLTHSSRPVATKAYEDFATRVLGKWAVSTDGTRTLPIEVLTWETRVVDGTEQLFLKAARNPTLFVFRKTGTLADKVFMALKTLRRGDLVGLIAELGAPDSPEQEIKGFVHIGLQVQFSVGAPVQFSLVPSEQRTAV